MENAKITYARDIYDSFCEIKGPFIRERLMVRGGGGGGDTIGQIKGRDAYTGKKHLEQSYITGNIIKMAAVQNR